METSIVSVQATASRTGILSQLMFTIVVLHRDISFLPNAQSIANNEPLNPKPSKPEALRPKSLPLISQHLTRTLTH